MNKEQYEMLANVSETQRMLNSRDFRLGKLMVGYTVDRSDFSVENTSDGFTIHVGALTPVMDAMLVEPQHCVPSKRVYPELCDYDFCVALIKAGVHIPFTTFHGDK